jgi:hypothetical protein
MLRLFLFVTLTSTLGTANLVAQSMVTSNVLQRVFALRVGSAQASAFTVDVDDQQYLITAKHALLTTQDPVMVLHNR